MKKTENINMRISAETKKNIEELANEYGMTITEYLLNCFTREVWNQEADETDTSMTLERAKRLTLGI